MVFSGTSTYVTWKGSLAYRQGSSGAYTENVKYWQFNISTEKLSWYPSTHSKMPIHFIFCNESQASCSTNLAGVPGRNDTDISRIFNGNDGASCQQELLPGPLRMCDVNAITFPLVLCHLEVQLGATSVGSCCKEREDILLLHLQDIKGSGHWESFPVRYVGTKNNTALTPLQLKRKDNCMFKGGLFLSCAYDGNVTFLSLPTKPLVKSKTLTS